jgi:hypothetical protein
MSDPAISTAPEAARSASERLISRFASTQARHYTPRGLADLSDVRESAHNRCRERGPKGLSVIGAAPASEAAREIDALAMKSTAQRKRKAA